MGSRRAGLCLLFWLLLGVAAQADEPSAVVFTYNRFGERGMAITNVTMAQFDAHLAELQSGKYTVLPLPQIIEALREGRNLPDRTVAITIDDAYRSFHDRAWPKLRKAGLPFTLFVWTDAIDHKLKDYISWDEIRALAKAGVTIGNHGAAHHDMALQTPEANRADIEKASQRFEAELGARPTLFAYPYGGYGKRERDLLAEFGFAAAFGHHSGVAYPGADLLALPRFALNEKHGGMARFKTAARALPLPARDITPADPVLDPGNNPPIFGFTVTGDIRGLAGLGCFASHQQAALKVERLGGGRTRRADAPAQRVEVRIPTAFPPGNHRVNCTMPVLGPTNSGRWRWLGQPFTVPRE